LGILPIGWQMNVYDGEHKPFWRDHMGQRFRVRIGLEPQSRFTLLSALLALRLRD
jgi:hypothetical protein